MNSVSFPQDSCGDSPPEAGSVESNYAVFFYPVYVGYSGKNLEKMQSQFCRDAFKTEREENGKTAIQVGSFLTEEKAEEFQSFLSQNFDQVEVGTPRFFASQSSIPKRACRDRFEADSEIFNVVILQGQEKIHEYCKVRNLNRDEWFAQFTSKSRAESFVDFISQEIEGIELDILQEGFFEKQSESMSEVAAASLLSESDVERLMRADRDNAKGIELKVVAPTYIPVGFYLEEVDVKYESIRFDPGYSLKYQNAEGVCFSISGSSGGFGAHIQEVPTVLIDSQVFGNIEMRILKEATAGKSSEQLSLDLTSTKLLNGQLYDFSSGYFCDRTLPSTEGKKILESLRYLNPD